MSPSYLKDPEMQRLFGRTLRHPEWHTYIVWAPTEWLLRIANPTPLTDTTTSGADGKPNRRVPLDELYATMHADGMRDPLVLGIGLQSKTVRLETGNQRIRCFAKHHIAYVPVIGYVSRTAITNQKNGHHLGKPWDIPAVLQNTPLQTYVDPTLFLPGAPLSA
jgi:hypothetical protein